MRDASATRPSPQQQHCSYLLLLLVALLTGVLLYSSKSGCVDNILGISTITPAPLFDGTRPEAAASSPCSSIPALAPSQQTCPSISAAQPACPSVSVPVPPACPSVSALPAARFSKWETPSKQGIRRHSRLADAAAAVVEKTRWGSSLVTFVSGNNAMVKFMLNEMLHIALHPVPFNVLWVPLDPAALARLAKDGNGTVYDAIASDGRFDGGRSNFREKDYNRMALVKWEITIQLLEMGYDVLLLDPDLALLRNPLPYFETIADCDMTLQMDSPMEPTGPNVIKDGGYAFREEHFDNFYNTGGILLKNSPRTLPWVRLYKSWAEGEYKRGSPYDDQALFNRFILNAYRLQLELSGHTSTGQYAYDTVMGNGCYRLAILHACACVDDCGPFCGSNHLVL